MSSSIAFKPEEGREALKDYEGQVIEFDYSEKPFGFEGAADIKSRGKVFGIKIQTTVYDKPQFEWYPPSMVKKTKWLNLIEALQGTGAMNDIKVIGSTDEERMKSFGQSMLGMMFKFQEIECESLVKLKGGEAKKYSVLLPVAYLGKKPIEKAPEVRQATIEEQVK